MRSGIRQLIGAALLIAAIGLPSCTAFNQALAQPRGADVTHEHAR